MTQWRTLQEVNAQHFLGALELVALDLLAYGLAEVVMCTDVIVNVLNKVT